MLLVVVDERGGFTGREEASERRRECRCCRALSRREGEKKQPLCGGDMKAAGCDRMSHQTAGCTSSNLSLSHTKTHTVTYPPVRQIKCQNHHHHLKKGFIINRSVISHQVEQVCEKSCLMMSIFSVLRSCSCEGCFRFGFRPCEATVQTASGHMVQSVKGISHNLATQRMVLLMAYNMYI